MIIRKLTAITAAIFLIGICKVEARPHYNDNVFCWDYCGYYKTYKVKHVRKHHSALKSKARALKKEKPVQVASIGQKPLPEAPTGLAAQAEKYLGMGARQVGVRLDLWCSAFIRKLTKTKGVDDRAISWIRRPKIAPAINAIAVMPHHVGIVVSVHKNYVVLISGNHSNRVVKSRYSRSRIIAYVSA